MSNKFVYRSFVDTRFKKKKKTPLKCKKAHLFASQPGRSAVGSAGKLSPRRDRGLPLPNPQAGRKLGFFFFFTEIVSVMGRMEEKGGDGQGKRPRALTRQ